VQAVRRADGGGTPTIGGRTIGGRTIGARTIGGTVHPGAIGTWPRVPEGRVRIVAADLCAVASRVTVRTSPGAKAAASPPGAAATGARVVRLLARLPTSAAMTGQHVRAVVETTRTREVSHPPAVAPRHGASRGDTGPRPAEATPIGVPTHAGAMAVSARPPVGRAASARPPTVATPVVAHTPGATTPLGRRRGVKGVTVRIRVATRAVVVRPRVGRVARDRIRAATTVVEIPTVAATTAIAVTSPEGSPRRAASTRVPRRRLGAAPVRVRLHGPAKDVGLPTAVVPLIGVTAAQGRVAVVPRTGSGPGDPGTPAPRAQAGPGLHGQTTDEAIPAVPGAVLRTVA
jgi:hypothetical protein